MCLNSGESARERGISHSFHTSFVTFTLIKSHVARADGELIDPRKSHAARADGELTDPRKSHVARFHST